MYRHIPYCCVYEGERTEHPKRSYYNFLRGGDNISPPEESLNARLGFQVSPVISGAKDLISSALSNAKRGKKKEDSHKSREQREFFFPCFSSRSTNFGVMLLKTTNRNENFFIRKVKATRLKGVRHSPISSSSSCRGAMLSSCGCRSRSPGGAPGAAAAPLPAGGHRRAAELRRAPAPGTAPGARSRVDNIRE